MPTKQIRRDCFRYQLRKNGDRNLPMEAKETIL